MDWPVMPIHMALMPDGRVLSFGTNGAGSQGAFSYDLWDPKTGLHNTLPNTTTTDLFCSTGTLFAEGATGKLRLTGQFAIAGGDVTVNGVRNYSSNGANLFNPATNGLSPAGTMQFARWYPTLLTLPTGEKALFGGRRDPSAYDGSLGPATEILSQTRGWRTLSGISIDNGHIRRTRSWSEWYYPRVAVGKYNLPFLFSQAGPIYRLSFAGVGSATDTGVLLDESGYAYPVAQLPNPKADPSSASYDPAASNYLYLSIRHDKKAVAVDIGTNPPTFVAVPDLGFKRVWGNLTVLADGKVLASGGCATNDPIVLQDPTDVEIPAYQTEVFDPSAGAAGTWTLGASAQKMRLYHSTTLLLPDGSVLTGGGGAPGPVTNVDAEIYYPAYLYDAAGNPKPRPTIVRAPKTVKYGRAFTIGVAAGDVIKGVRLVQMGTNTHTYTPDQHYLYVPFTQAGTNITANASSDPTNFPPGYYMLFVFNQDDTPSVAAIVSVPQRFN